MDRKTVNIITIDIVSLVAKERFSYSIGIHMITTLQAKNTIDLFYIAGNLKQ